MSGSTEGRWRELDRSRLGFALSGALGVAYLGFVLACALSPSLLARPVLRGGTVNWAFALGLAVIGLGVALTFAYVLTANRAEARRTAE